MTKPQASLFTATDELELVLGPDLAREFLAHRRLKRAPLTPYGAKLMADKLRTFPDPVASVNQSIIKGWSDVFPIDAPRPTRGVEALEADLAKRITNEQRQSGAGSVDSETLSGTALVGWQGNSTHH